MIIYESMQYDYDYVKKFGIAHAYCQLMNYRLNVSAESIPGQSGPGVGLCEVEKRRGQGLSGVLVNFRRVLWRHL